MNLIEKFENKFSGYHPYLIREGWQVAQLNYMEEQHIDNIQKMDVHRQTDEAFWLQSGNAVLIAVDMSEGSLIFHTELMMEGVVYNIPKNVWHNIAMRPGSEVMIVEKSNTHLGDFEFFKLDKQQRCEMKEKVNKAFNETILANK